MKKRYRYAFTKKEETEGGRVSVIFGTISLCLFLISACLSFA